MTKTKRQLDTEIAKAISDRRLAVLRAAGEDVRNTVAWRDAVSESRMIRIMSGAPSKRVAPSGHERVAITWYAIPNENKARGGYMPVYEHAGKVRGDTYGRGYDKDEAEQRAEAMAHEEAARYVGDWDVTVKKGRAKK
jgi:hypothetical protein